LLCISRMDNVSSILIGGGMAYTLLQAQGDAVSKSLVETDRVELACELLAKAQAQQVQIALPSDHVIAQAITAEAQTRIVMDDGIPPDWNSWKTRICPNCLS
jgi:phosphoglycerate kinase